MNTQYPTPENTKTTVEPLPPALESSNSKLVYFYLQISGPTTSDELQRALGLKKITLYPVLETLSAADLVTKTGTKYHCQDRPIREDSS